MNEESTFRRPPRTPAAPRGNRPTAPVPALQIDVPLGIPYQEIQEAIFLRACRRTGTPLRAAIALGVPRDTVVRVMRPYERRQAGHSRIPEPWPLLTPRQLAANAGAADDLKNLSRRWLTDPRSYPGCGRGASTAAQTNNKDTDPDDD